MMPISRLKRIGYEDVDEEAAKGGPAPVERGFQEGGGGGLLLDVADLRGTVGAHYLALRMEIAFTGGQVADHAFRTDLRAAVRGAIGSACWNCKSWGKGEAPESGMPNYRMWLGGVSMLEQWAKTS